MRILKKTSWLVALGLMVSISGKAQTDITELLKLYERASKDVTVIAYEYMKPFGEEFGKTLNTGWYTSAKPHKLGGFDITFSATAIPISSKMKSFELSKLNLTELGYAQGATSPTVLGKDVDGAEVYLKANPTTRMNLPQGSNIPVLPMVNYNIGVGLPFHTDVAIRFVPNIKIKDEGKFGMWGFGIRNEFKEFIPVFKLLPFSMSAFFGMTKYNLSWDLKDNDYANKAYKDQKLSTDATSYTARLLVSKSIPVLTVYGGLGYNSNSSDYKLKGHYQYANSPLPPYQMVDPFNLSYTSTGFVANAGFRVKLAVFMLFADYTYANTSMYTAGMGFTFR